MPFRQTCTTSRGVRLNAPQPVSLLVITNPANTTGLSAPDAPVNGLRYPASSAGASARTCSQTTRTYIRRSVRSHPSTWTGAPDWRTPSRTAISTSRLSMNLYPSDRNARATPVPLSAAQAAEQEPALIAVQPPVHVRVVQVRALLTGPPQVSGGDAELVGDALVADVRRGVGAGRQRDAVLAEHRRGAIHDQLPTPGTDRGRRGDDIDLAGLLLPQQTPPDRSASRSARRAAPRRYQGT